MNRRLGLIWNYVSHYKYLITVIVGGLIVGVVDENSIRQHLKYQFQIRNLNAEIEKYNSQNENDLKTLKEMQSGTKAYEKIARERYFMKADDEDIFVLSTDLPTDENIQEDNDETVE